MGDWTGTAPVAGLASKGRIAPDDVLMLRREVFRDGVVTRGEAEALFALDGSCTDKCAEWAEFFVEALTDYIVHQEKPQGYISEENADWLIRAVSRDGMVDSAVELELLVKVLEQARSAPERLEIYALKQVALAATEGNGPLARGRRLTAGVIERAEVDLLRRILYAFGGSGNAAITRAEADILFEINDRTVEEMNDPSWSELFVKAIANHVLAGQGFEIQSREDALRHEALFETAEVNILGFFGRMVSGGAEGVRRALETPLGIEGAWAERNARNAVSSQNGVRVEAGEAEWLADRISRDRLLHDNERALLAFIAAESPDVHPSLQPLVAKVA